MALKLKWRNDNTQTTTVRIYRSSTPFDKSALPAVLATVPAGTNSYTDSTVLFGQTYYYMLETVSPNDSVFTIIQKVEVTDKRGAGTSILKYGDDGLGYFGKLTSSDFFTAPQILAVAKSQSGMPASVVTPNWHKYSRNGKTLFVPDQTLGRVSWASLYAAGFVAGVDSNGDIPQSGVSVNQKTTIGLNGESYLIRLPRGFSSTEVWDGTQTEVEGFAAWVPAEYDDLILPMMSTTPTSQRGVNVGNGAPAYNFLPSGSSSDANVGIACMETNNVKNTHLRRGAGVGSGQPPRSWVARAIPSSMAQQHNWFPVLELIDPVQTINL